MELGAMDDHPLISIVLPVHNGERFLQQAIKSCLEQTYSKIELIIVDDCSSDNTNSIAQKFADIDDRVQVKRNSVQKKLPASLNIGHACAKGDLITWTSDDNIYHKDALEKLYSTLLEENVDVVYSEYLIIDDSGTLVERSNLNTIEYLFFSGVVGACFIYKKEVFERNDGYREDLFLVEDYDFWLRALKHSTYYKIDNPGYYFYRYHRNSLTVRMRHNEELKNMFISNLSLLYNDLFSDKALENKDELILFLIERHLYGPNRSILAFQRNFFDDIEAVASSFKGFSGRKLKQIFFLDAIETLLKNRRFQKPSVLIRLHVSAKGQLLELPINRYFAIFKKCLF